MKTDTPHKAKLNALLYLSKVVRNARVYSYRSGVYVQENHDVNGLHNKTDAKISDCQTSKQQFCWRMNRSHFIKGDHDQAITQRCVIERKMFKAGRNTAMT